MYLKKNCALDRTKILSLFNKVKEKALDNGITPEVFLKALEELTLTAEIGRIIAELKGGDIMSPCLRELSLLRYEINPSLIERMIPDGP